MFKLVKHLILLCVVFVLSSCSLLQISGNQVNCIEYQPNDTLKYFFEISESGRINGLSKFRKRGAKWCRDEYQYRFNQKGRLAETSYFRCGEKSQVLIEQDDQGISKLLGDTGQEMISRINEQVERNNREKDVPKGVMWILTRGPQQYSGQYMLYYDRYSGEISKVKELVFDEKMDATVEDGIYILLEENRISMLYMQKKGEKRDETLTFDKKGRLEWFRYYDGQSVPRAYKVSELRKVFPEGCE